MKEKQQTKGYQVGRPDFIYIFLPPSSSSSFSSSSLSGSCRSSVGWLKAKP